MNTRLTTAILIPAMVFTAGCQDKDVTPEEDISAWTGVVINEISAHSQSAGATSSVELLNTAAESVDISGLGLYLTDRYSSSKSLWSAPEGTVLKAGERLLLSTADKSLRSGILSNITFDLKLASGESSTAIDEFSSTAAFGSARAQSVRGSYQRIPDGTSTWKNLTWSSLGTENELFDIDETSSFGIWVWSSYVEELLANDCAQLKSLKSNGIGHIFLNYAAFTSAKKSRTVAFITKAEELGMVVHAWTQCFHSSDGWIYPINSNKGTYRDDIFNTILSDAKDYIENYGVKGIHLDYIRFPGNAEKYNINDEVNSVGAVTRCCREIRELCDSYGEGLVVSAAMMPDETADGKYYGQNRTEMGQYVNIFIPMIYRYDYKGYDDDLVCQNKANAFANCGARCWAGTTTYTGGDKAPKPMDAESVLRDCSVFKGTDAEGIVLFRKGLGEVPDFTDFSFE